MTRLRCGAVFACAGAARERDAYAGRALRGMRAAGDRTGKIARGRGKLLDAAEKIWYYNLVIVYAVYAPRGDCDFLCARSSAG